MVGTIAFILFIGLCCMVLSYDLMKVWLKECCGCYGSKNNQVEKVAMEDEEESTVRPEQPMQVEMAAAREMNQEYGTAQEDTKILR